VLKKIDEGEPNIISEIKKGKIHLVFNTPKKGKVASTDGFRIRRACLEHGIPCITNFEACEALVQAIEHSHGKQPSLERVEDYGRKK